MKKRLKMILILSLFLILGFSCGWTVVHGEKRVQAETNEGLQGTCGENLKWVLEDNVLTISGTGEIPASFVRKMEKQYEDFYAEDIEKIKIENGITKIGNEAFEKCEFLEEVKMPESVKEIGISAFWYCTELKEINLPDALKTIGEHAFRSCYSVEQLIIPENISEIGDGAFQYCINITSINWPKKLTTMNDYMFYNCSSLEKIELPDGLKEIGTRAFGGCDKLEKIMIPKTVNVIGDAAFSGCDILKYIEIPDSVTELGREAFDNCENLEYVKLSKNIKVLRGRTFDDCNSITSIEIPDSVETMEYQAIISCSKLKYVVIPKSVVDMEYNCMGDRTGNAVIIGDPSSKAAAYAQENHVKFISYDNWKCDHKYTYEVLKQATLKEDGLEIDRCEKCGKTILAQISHPVSLRTINTSNTYNGGKIEPIFEIKLANGETMENKYCQCIDGKNNVYSEFYKYTVSLKDKYAGTMEGAYTINKATRIAVYSGMKEIVKSYDKPFCLKIRYNGPFAEMEYKVSDPQILNIDETGNIRANRVGRCVITAYAKEDHNYKQSNEIKVKVQIIPAKVKVISMKAKAGSKVYLKWQRDAKVDGYYINYATKSNMLGGRIIRTKNNKTTKVTLKNMKRKKKYYIEIYGYKKVKEGKRFKEVIGNTTKKTIKTK